MNNKEINKKYNHLEVEKNKYDFWLKNHLFDSKNSIKKFSIILPPPNVTGHLHLGHAWDSTYQDILIRFKRLCNYCTLWIPGTDHAGIATQTKFEKVLKETKNITKDDLGKTEFLNQLWIWKQSQSDFIHSQWKKLGLALNYECEKFTMDSDVNYAVNKVFVDLYNKNLIYQEKKIVNWDPVLKTAISDIEVIYKETNSKMYYLKYWTQDRSDFIIVATTRPETMFGDVCLFTNPNNTKYLKYKNTKFINPANNKLIPLLFDDYVDINFGTGIMKCTPAHDFNDYELAKKHHLEFINILNPDGSMNDLCYEFKGLDRFECRKQLIQKLQQNDLVIKIEDIKNNIGYSERSNCIVEPYISKQWFIKMKPIIDKVIKNQIDNKTLFHPIRFNKVLLKWLENIQDWCISRQLWWGHQIPIWFNKQTNEIHCSIYGPKDPKNWIRDPNVLDTWFSSSLWPLVTLNWPDKNNKLFAEFFPTDVLVTGYDIIFFWVSRMMAQTVENENSIPFKNVLIHGLIRDEQGRKMSKSLGNGIDPMDVIDEFGCDSLRLFLTSTAKLGEDLNFSKTKISYYWNFINKLWNGFRFIYQLIQKHNIEIVDINKLNNLSIIDQYILNKLNNTIKIVTKNFESYNFVISTKELVDFIWNEFNNNYLELTKIDIKNNNLTCINVLYYVLKQVIIMLHPQAPFITEEIYQLLFTNQNNISIMNEIWPIQKEYNIKNIDAANYLFDLIKIINKIRLENNLNKNDTLEISIKFFDNSNAEKFKVNFELINFYLKEMNVILNFDLNFGNIYISNYFQVEYKKTIDKKLELQKLLDQKLKLEDEIKRSENILNNENFIQKAKPEKIEIEKQKYEKYKNQLNQLLIEINKITNEIN